MPTAAAPSPASLTPPPWAVALFRCSLCPGSLEAGAGGELFCTRCAARYSVDRGVVDFLGDPHPAVVSERRAVAAIDAGEISLPVAEAPDGGEGEEGGAERAFRRHVEQSRRQLRRVLASRPLEPGTTVVELGADSCWASQLFLDAGCRVLAVDITSHLHLAERASDPNLCRLQSDMNALPLADASVETVWATAAAHHSWDLGATFREAARVLKPGGRLYFCCEPMPSWLRWPLGLAVGEAERELGIHETWVPRWRWLALARRAGFRVRLVFPELSDAQMAERLRARSVPDALAPALGALVRPALRVLQVSIHLVGRLET